MLFFHVGASGSLSLEKTSLAERGVPVADILIRASPCACGASHLHVNQSNLSTIKMKLPGRHCEFSLVTGSERPAQLKMQADDRDGLE